MDKYVHIEHRQALVYKPCFYFHGHLWNKILSDVEYGCRQVTIARRRKRFIVPC